MNHKRFVTVMLVVIFLFTVAPMAAFAKKPPVTEVSNNLSFPAIAVDGFSIANVLPSFTVPYTGDYPGLTADEIAALLASGPWYAQKTTGNTWQAGFENKGSESVTYIDWSDNMEGVSPKVRRTFRLELVLFKTLELPKTAYTMAVLEYPSSATELQGTNTTTYESYLATVISNQPNLVVQYLGTEVPADMTWLGTQWNYGTVVPVSFGPELNVGGKYIYGASQGGWKPDKAGYYRVTFYIPAGSGVDLSGAYIGNIPNESVATAYVDTVNNLTYIDLLAINK